MKLAEAVESASPEDFVREVAGTVSGILARRVASSQAIEELGPELVKMLLAARRQYKPNKSARAWILSTIRERISQEEPPLAGSPSGIPAGRAPEELARDEGLVKAVRGLLTTLSPESREALELIAVEGLRPRDAGEVIGQPAAIVEKLASDAFSDVIEKLVTSPEAAEMTALKLRVASEATMCRDVSETLLARVRGKIEGAEAEESARHIEKCAQCRGLVADAERAYALLRAYRIATDRERRAWDFTELVEELSKREKLRVERLEMRRQTASEIEAPKKRRLAIVMVILLGLLIGGAAAIHSFINRPPELKVNAIADLVPAVTDGARARDLAVVLDLQLLDEWAMPNPREERLAGLAWARHLARREGFADGPEFVRAILNTHARLASRGWRFPEGVVCAADGADPLRELDSLELAGLVARAASTAARLAEDAAKKGDEELRRRAELHRAAALLRAGKLDDSEAALQPLLPPVGEDGAVQAGDFRQKLANILYDRIARARAARESLKNHKRPAANVIDTDGAFLATAALDLDAVLGALTGRDATYRGAVQAGWAHLMRGELAEAYGLLFLVRQKAGTRYLQSIARLGLSEIAFLEGRYSAGLSGLQSAMEKLTNNAFVALIALQQGMRECLDTGCVAGITPLVGEARQSQFGRVSTLIAEKLEPRVAPLADARYRVTSTWPKVETAFTKILGDAPGTVSPRDVLAVDFEKTALPFEAVAPVRLEAAAGLEGQCARFTSTAREVSARLPLGKPEVETWLAFAVKLAAKGELIVWAEDAAGRRYEWRTAALDQGLWYRLALPLGALEPADGDPGDASIIGGQVASVGWTFRFFGAGKTLLDAAVMDLDSVLVHYGRELPDGVDVAVHPEYVEPPELPTAPETPAATETPATEGEAPAGAEASGAEAP